MDQANSQISLADDPLNPALYEDPLFDDDVLFDDDQPDVVDFDRLSHPAMDTGEVSRDLVEQAERDSPADTDPSLLVEAAPEWDDHDSVMAGDDSFAEEDELFEPPDGHYGPDSFIAEADAFDSDSLVDEAEPWSSESVVAEEDAEDDDDAESWVPAKARRSQRRQARKEAEKAKRARAVPVAPAAPVISKRRGLGTVVLALIATLVVVGLLLVHVWSRYKVLTLGYELTELSTEREDLLEKNRRLKIELRVLSRKDRLEPLANRQLGLIRPRTDQVLFVPRTQLPMPSFPSLETNRVGDIDE